MGSVWWTELLDGHRALFFSANTFRGCEDSRRTLVCTIAFTWLLSSGMRLHWASKQWKRKAHWGGHSLLLPVCLWFLCSWCNKLKFENMCCNSWILSTIILIVLATVYIIIDVGLWMRPTKHLPFWWVICTGLHQVGRQMKHYRLFSWELATSRICQVFPLPHHHS